MGRSRYKIYEPTHPHSVVAHTYDIITQTHHQLKQQQAIVHRAFFGKGVVFFFSFEWVGLKLRCF